MKEYLEKIAVLAITGENGDKKICTFFAQEVMPVDNGGVTDGMEGDEKLLTFLPYSPYRFYSQDYTQ